MARRGRFGQEYVLGPLRNRTPGWERVMVPLQKVCTPEGLLIKGHECDAADFLLDVLQALAWQERAFEGLDWQSTRSVVDEIFGFITRRRYHCPRSACRFTRDVCILEQLVTLDLPKCAEPLVLRELWEARWRKTNEPEGFCCPSEHLGRAVQDFMETEPPCLIIRLGRTGKTVDGLGEKISSPVSFPRRLDWMRSGHYDFAGAILHEGKTQNSGHYSAACMVDPSAVDRSTDRFGFAHFDDAAVKGKRWSFFQEREQQQNVYMMVYTRVARRVANPETGASLSYAVGEAMENFRERASFAQIRIACHDGASGSCIR